MTTPERILNSRQMRVFMDWFTLFFFAACFAVIAVVLVGFLVGFVWWLA